jgi:hypothetical protein
MRSPLGITWFSNKIKLSKFDVIEFFFKLLDCDWIWIGLTIQKNRIEQQPARDQTFKLYLTSTGSVFDF